MPGFEVKCDAKLLQPSHSMLVDCFFMPSETRAYSEKIVFEINGYYHKFVTLKGKGTAVKVFNIADTIIISTLLTTD